MKILFIILALISLKTQATEYCYDRAVMSLEHLEKLIRVCSFQMSVMRGEGLPGVTDEYSDTKNASVPLIQQSQKKLMTWNPVMFERRNRAQLSKLQDYIDSLETGPEFTCVNDIKNYFSEKTYFRVSEAIEVCRF
jgi:hypothetical protein